MLWPSLKKDEEVMPTLTVKEKIQRKPAGMDSTVR
jgi:hypothetical protein